MDIPEVIREVFKNASVLDSMLVARSTSEEELIDLLVEGFRQILEQAGPIEPDFTDGPINSYAFYLPVVMLIQDPEWVEVET